MKIILSLSLSLIFSVTFAASNTGLLFNVTVNKPDLIIRPNINFYYPIAGIQITSPGFTLQNQQQVCTLSASGYCLFAVSPSQPKTFTLTGGGPLTYRLCTNGDAPINCQNYATDFSTQFVYISNDNNVGANSVTRCKVLANGNFDECARVGDGLDNPFDLVFNANNSTVYITNSNYVAKCDIASNGDLTNCHRTGIDFINPGGITINPSNTSIYVADSGVNKVVKCDISPNDDLINCNDSGIDFFGPVGITINNSGTRIYITNVRNNNVAKCEFTPNGLLTNCSNSGTNMIVPVGITFNTTETRIYIVNAPPLAENSVTKCDLDDDGNLINCTSAGSTNGSESRFITFNDDETFAYITNAADNNVSKCEVQRATGNLINCVFAAPNIIGATGIQLVKLPI